MADQFLTDTEVDSGLAGQINRQLLRDIFLLTNRVLGEMGWQGNVTSQTKQASPAVEKLTNTQTGALRGFTYASDQLTVAAKCDGQYQLAWTLNVTSDTAGTFEFAVRKNGTIFGKSRSGEVSLAANVPQMLSRVAIDDLVAGDVLEMACTGPTGAQITISYGGLVVSRK